MATCPPTGPCYRHSAFFILNFRDRTMKACGAWENYAQRLLAMDRHAVCGILRFSRICGEFALTPCSRCEKIDRFAQPAGRRLENANLRRLRSETDERSKFR